MLIQFHIVVRSIPSTSMSGWVCVCVCVDVSSQSMEFSDKHSAMEVSRQAFPVSFKWFKVQSSYTGGKTGALWTAGGRVVNVPSDAVWNLPIGPYVGFYVDLRTDTTGFYRRVSAPDVREVVCQWTPLPFIVATREDTDELFVRRVRHYKARRDKDLLPWTYASVKEMVDAVHTMSGVPPVNLNTDTDDDVLVETLDGTRVKLSASRPPAKPSRRSERQRKKVDAPQPRVFKRATPRHPINLNTFYKVVWGKFSEHVLQTPIADLEQSVKGCLDGDDDCFWVKWLLHRLCNLRVFKPTTTVEHITRTVRSVSIGLGDLTGVMPKEFFKTLEVVVNPDNGFLSSFKYSDAFKALDPNSKQGQEHVKMASMPHWLPIATESFAGPTPLPTADEPMPFVKPTGAVSSYYDTDESGNRFRSMSGAEEVKLDEKYKVLKKCCGRDLVPLIGSLDKSCFMGSHRSDGYLHTLIPYVSDFPCYVLGTDGVNGTVLVVNPTDKSCLVLMVFTSAVVLQPDLSGGCVEEHRFGKWVSVRRPAPAVAVHPPPAKTEVPFYIGLKDKLHAHLRQPVLVLDRKTVDTKWVRRFFRVPYVNGLVLYRASKRTKTAEPVETLRMVFEMFDLLWEYIGVLDHYATGNLQCLMDLEMAVVDGDKVVFQRKGVEHDGRDGELFAGDGKEVAAAMLSTILRSTRDISLDYNEFLVDGSSELQHLSGKKRLSSNASMARERLATMKIERKAELNSRLGVRLMRLRKSRLNQQRQRYRKLSKAEKSATPWDEEREEALALEYALKTLAANKKMSLSELDVEMDREGGTLEVDDDTSGVAKEMFAGMGGTKGNRSRQSKTKATKTGRRKGGRRQKPTQNQTEHASTVLDTIVQTTTERFKEVRREEHRQTPRVWVEKEERLATLDKTLADIRRDDETALAVQMDTNTKVVNHLSTLYQDMDNKFLSYDDLEKHYNQQVMDTLGFSEEDFSQWTKLMEDYISASMEAGVGVIDSISTVLDALRKTSEDTDDTEEEPEPVAVVPDEFVVAPPPPADVDDDAPVAPPPRASRSEYGGGPDAPPFAPTYDDTGVLALRNRLRGSGGMMEGGGEVGDGVAGGAGKPDSENDTDGEEEEEDISPFKPDSELVRMRTELENFTRVIKNKPLCFFALCELGFIDGANVDDCCEPVPTETMARVKKDVFEKLMSGDMMVDGTDGNWSVGSFGSRWFDLDAKAYGLDYIRGAFYSKSFAEDGVWEHDKPYVIQVMVEKSKAGGECIIAGSVAGGAGEAESDSEEEGEPQLYGALRSAWRMFTIRLCQRDTQCNGYDWCAFKNDPTNGEKLALGKSCWVQQVDGYLHHPIHGWCAFTKKKDLKGIYECILFAKVCLKEDKKHWQTCWDYIDCTLPDWKEEDGEVPNMLSYQSDCLDIFVERGDWQVSWREAWKEVRSTKVNLFEDMNMGEEKVIWGIGGHTSELEDGLVIGSGEDRYKGRVFGKTGWKAYQLPTWEAEELYVDGDGMPSQSFYEQGYGGGRHFMRQFRMAEDEYRGKKQQYKLDKQLFEDRGFATELDTAPEKPSRSLHFWQVVGNDDFFDAGQQRPIFVSKKPFNYDGYTKLEGWFIPITLVERLDTPITLTTRWMKGEIVEIVSVKPSGEVIAGGGGDDTDTDGASLGSQDSWSDESEMSENDSLLEFVVDDDDDDGEDKVDEDEEVEAEAEAEVDIVDATPSPDETTLLMRDYERELNSLREDLQRRRAFQPSPLLSFASLAVEQRIAELERVLRVLRSRTPSPPQREWRIAGQSGGAKVQEYPLEILPKLGVEWAKPSSIVIRPEGGTWKKHLMHRRRLGMPGTPNLVWHVGVSDISGSVYHFLEDGVHKSYDGWRHCLSLPLGVDAPVDMMNGIAENWMGHVYKIPVRDCKDFMRACANTLLGKKHPVGFYTAKAFTRLDAIEDQIRSIKAFAGEGDIPDTGDDFDHIGALWDKIDWDKVEQGVCVNIKSSELEQRQKNVSFA